MDEVVARQLPSRTLGHTPAESEDEEGTSLRDLRDESRLGAARLGKSTVTTTDKKSNVVDKLRIREMMKGESAQFSCRYVLAPPVRPRDVHGVRHHKDADGEGPPSHDEAVHINIVGRRSEDERGQRFPSFPRAREQD